MRQRGSGHARLTALSDSHVVNASAAAQSSAAAQPVSAENVEEFTPQDWVLFLSISLIWGASFLLIAFALEGLTAGMITLGRVGGGALTLAVLRIVSKGRTIERADWPRIIMLSFTWIAIPFTLFPIAQEWINSALTGLLNGATPIFVAVLATILTKVAPRGMQAIGLAIGFAGVVLISVSSGVEGSADAWKGILLVLGATVCYGISINVAAPLQARYRAVTLMAPVLALATLWTLPLGLRNLGDNSWDARPVLAVIFLGVVGTGLAYWIMATLVGRVGPVRASFITYLIPVVSLVLGMTLRDDTVAALAIVGAALTIAGAFLASRKAS